MPSNQATDFHQRLGQMLAGWREELGLSQEALAVQVRRDQSYLSRIEAGERHASLTFLLEWADAMGVPFDEVARRLSTTWQAWKLRAGDTV